MKSFFSHKTVLIGLTLLFTLLTILVMSACDTFDPSETTVTTEAQDPGFVIESNELVRVETHQDGSVLHLYVDEDKNTIDLNALAQTKKSFTVTDSQGLLVQDNKITINNNGDIFTVFYGGEKITYRIIVYFNVYCNVNFETFKEPIRVLKGATVSPPDTVPQKTGYTFKSWNFDFHSVITDDINISANWTAKTYTLTFDPKGGALPNQTMNVTFGESVNLPVPVMDGYVFMGWHDGFTIINSGIWTIDSDITLSAMWDNHDYKITYDPNGGEVDKTFQGVSYGESFVPPTPKRSGFTFVGWFCDGAPVNTSAFAYREDKTFVAEWKENIYNVTFESNGGSAIAGGEYLYTEMTELVPIRDGCTFGGWFFDMGLTMKDADVTNGNAVTAYAWWIEEDKPSLYIYEITDKGAVILGFLSDNVTAVIPSYIGGVKTVEIGFEAFKGCTSLETVIFSNSINKIGDYAFFGATSLKNINPSSDESVFIDLSGITAIGAYAFAECAFSEIVLPSALTSLSEGVFNNCKNLKSVSLGALESLGAYVFAGCDALETLAFSGDFTKIGDYAFSNCFTLSKITLPNTITVIGKGAFSGCTSLVSLILPFSVTVISDEAFKGCSALTTLTNYTSLVKLTTIGAYGFSGCEVLNTIGVPASVTSIGAYAFEKCLKLENVNIPAAITVIDDGTFKDCSYLKTITFAAPITSIGDYAFASCRRLNSITLTQSLQSIGNYAFENCIAISTLSLGANIKFIGTYAFKGCTRLTEATLGEYITVVPEGIFEGCLALLKINWHKDITEISSRAFAGCQALSFDFFPSSCTVIGTEAFSGCQAIQTIDIGYGLTSIGARAFADCISLTKISFSGTSERWKGACAKDAFEGCVDLKTIETVIWTYDDLRASLVHNSATKAYWGFENTLAFNSSRPAAVIEFQKNDVFYKNLVSVIDGKATVSEGYTWKLTVKGEILKAGIVSSFSTVITVSMFEVYDFGTYGFIILDLGESIAAQTDISSLDLGLEIYSSSDSDKLLYTASLGKIEIQTTLSEIVPDSDRVDHGVADITTITPHAESLFDGNAFTKYFSKSREPIIVQADNPFVLSSYSFITTATQSSYPYTLPVGWIVYGGIVLKDGDVEWVEVSRVENGQMTMSNLTEFHYTVTQDRAYSQYKIEFESINCIMLSEIVFYKK